MSYVFDTSPLVSLFKNYYRERFPTLWELFDDMIEKDQITSTREVFREIEDQSDDLSEWAKENRDLFVTPNVKEATFVAEIFQNNHFQGLIERKKILTGGKNADPFVIARAASTGGTIVTLEKFKDNAAKIPNIANHFSVPCIDLVVHPAIK